jgi:hypothetical protein
VGKLQVTRRGLVGVLRRVKVDVEGETVLRLGHRATGTVESPPGPHSIVAKMDWAHSAPLDITMRDDETTKVEIHTEMPLVAFWRFLSSPGSMFHLRLVP